MPAQPTTDIAMLELLAAPAGKDVVDIGCGGGGLARALARRGARVIGVEVSAGQLAAAVSTEQDDPAATPTYRIGTAQALPVDDEAVDLAVFMRTLHHVPPAELATALKEACRVTRPGGLVYVAEPLPEGDYFELTRLVEDELEVRRAAEQAIARAKKAGLEHHATVLYDVRFDVPSLDAFRARNVSANPDRAPVFDAKAPEIAAAFARLGEPGPEPGPEPGEPGAHDPARSFIQPMRADVLRRPER